MVKAVLAGLNPASRSLSRFGACHTPTVQIEYCSRLLVALLNEKLVRDTHQDVGVLLFHFTRIDQTKVEVTNGIQFTSVLINLYRDGKDGVGWHRDQDRELRSRSGTTTS